MRAILLAVIGVILIFLIKAKQDLASTTVSAQKLYHDSRNPARDSTSLLNQFLLNKTRSQIDNEERWIRMISQSMDLHQQGLRDSALKVGQRVLLESAGVGNRLVRIRALLNLGIIQQENYIWEEAARNLVQAEKLLRHTDPPDLCVDVKNRQGLLYSHMGNYSVAIQYFHEVYNNYFSGLDRFQKGRLYNNLGSVYLNMGDLAQSESMFRRASKEIGRNAPPVLQAEVNFNIGKINYKKKHYSQAWDLIMKSLQVFLSAGEKVKAEEASRMMGLLHMEQADYYLALDFFEQSLELALDLKNPRTILQSYRNIFINYSLIREKTNNQNYLLRELEVFKKWAYLNDSLYQDQTTERILELEKQYETEKKNNQINLLEKEKQITEDQLKIGQVQRKYLFIFVILILIVLGFFIYSFTYYRRMTYLLQRQSRHIMNQQTHITRQNEKLQKAVGTQNKLFSIIAHDLRSPLISLSNISKLINLYIRSNRFEAAGDLAMQMDRKNDHLLELTDNLLSWTKSQSENFKPVLEKVRLNEVVQECFKIYKSVSLDKEIILSHNCGSEFYLLADRNILQTVFRNLINNAIKFTPRKGKVEITCRQEGHFAKITIQDNGIGISKERLNSIFEIDVNNIQSGTEGEKSTGLGLSVCREFIEIMGGSIYAESEEGTGSKFVFTVPLYNAVV